jgi:YidC/Oxa1 family membrane protein insertase
VDEQKRLLLALVLMAVVVVVMTSFWPSAEQPSPQRPDAATADSEGAGQADEPEGESDDASPEEAQPSKEVRRSRRELHPQKQAQLRTPKLLVEIDTRGGGLTKAELLDEQFREGRGEKATPINLVSVNTTERPELMPLAFNLVTKQATVPSSSETAEGIGVLRLINHGSINAERLEAVAEVGAKVASSIIGDRPFTTLEDLNEVIGGSKSQQRQVVSRLLEAAWRTGFVRLDFELLREEDDRVVLRGLTDGGVEVRRTYTLVSDYELRLVDRLINRSDRRLNIRERLIATGRENQVSSGGWFQRPIGQIAGLCAVNDEVLRSNRAQLAGESSGCMTMGCNGSSGPMSRTGAVRFVSVDRHFFMAAVSPSPSWGAASCDLRAVSSGELTVALEPLMFTEVEPGSAATYASTTYLGPKKYSLLRELGPGRRLWEAIDYGWFAVLSHILLGALQIFHGWMGNWGLAIIFLTFVIKIILLPVTHKSLKSMRQMQADMAKLKPQMDEVNERYKSQPDIKQQKLMELYQQNGINPLKQMSGCLPMFLQMPIWIALYRMISESVELYRAPFYLWLDDLSAQDPYYVLPALLGVAMFLQQAVTPTPGMDNTQAKMMKWMMPAMFLIIMINMPAGLVLYIFANTLLTIVQQQFINRMIPAAPAPAGAGSEGSSRKEDGASTSSPETDSSARKNKSKRRKRK